MSTPQAPEQDGTTPDARELSREAIARVDSSGQLDDVLALPEHLRDALWRVESAIMQGWDTSSGLVVAGMGGSAIGGALARAALGDHASRPIFVTRAYGLPPWTTPDTMVLCASYSGNTEETLACYESAGALGAQRVVVTTGGRLAEMARADGVPVIPLPGGFQPRAAVAYMTVAALEVAALCGAGPRLTSEIDVAASHTEQLVAEWGPDAGEDSPAKTVARGLLGTIPVVAGAGLTTPIAYRWKTQINENSKLPCFTHELPELDHNELVGLGRRRGIEPTRPVRGGVPRRLRRPPAREGADGLDRAADRSPRRGELPSGNARADHDRAGDLARAAGRSGVDLPGGDARGRSRPGEGDRRSEGGARASLSPVGGCDTFEVGRGALRRAPIRHARPFLCSKGAHLIGQEAPAMPAITPPQPPRCPQRNHADRTTSRSPISPWPSSAARRSRSPSTRCRA